MEQTTKGSAAARMAVRYITVGILLVVWTVIGMVFLANNAVRGGWWYAAYGCLGSGFALAVIGFLTGRVGRAARQADLPPTVSATPAPGPMVAMPPMTPVPPQPVAAPPLAAVGPQHRTAY